MGRRGRLCVTPSGETEYGIALPMIGLGARLRYQGSPSSGVALPEGARARASVNDEALPAIELADLVACQAHLHGVGLELCVHCLRVVAYDVLCLG